MSAPFSIGPGITIGGGILIGTTPTITISSSDFNFGNHAGGNTEYITPSSGDLYCPFYYLNSPVGSIATTITDFFTACGYDINTSYVFHAKFASANVGGITTSNYSCLVRADWNTSGEFDMVVIDQSNPNWTSGNPNLGTQLEGTFTLPVTLTPYSPTTSMGSISWC